MTDYSQDRQQASEAKAFCEAVRLGSIPYLEAHDISGYAYYSMPYDTMPQDEMRQYLDRSFPNGPVPRAPLQPCIITMQLERFRHYYLVRGGSAAVLQLRDGYLRLTKVFFKWGLGRFTLEHDEEGDDLVFAEMLYKLLFIYCEMITEEPDWFRVVR